MLIEQEDGTYLAGPFDVLCILYDPVKNRYHAAFFEEKPFAGPVPEVADTEVVRLKSKMHHTEGATDLEGALLHLDEMVRTIRVPPENIWRKPRTWDADLVAAVWIVPNWRKNPTPRL
jgi:hypothetical protein